MITENAMFKHNKTVFHGRNVLPCLLPTELDVFYIDDSKEQRKCILLEHVENERNLFKITNPTHKTIVLFAIDGCFIGRSKPPEHCDCIFFNDTTFCFAEMKFESESTSDLTIQNNRTKAVRQLRSTFGIFQKAFDDNFLGLTLEAYVCTPEHYRQMLFEKC